MVKSGWSSPLPVEATAAGSAREAAARLSAALRRIGFDVRHDFANLRGDVNIYQQPIVTLGRFSDVTAHGLAAALTWAVDHECPHVRTLVSGR